MKITQICFLILGLVLISSCALKVPAPQNPANGIVVIPVQVHNSTNLAFARYYKLSSSLDPDVVITIYPTVGQNFVFSGELSPGKYYFDKFTSILNSTTASSTVHKNVNSINSIIVTVQPGTASVAGSEIVLSQIPAGPHAFRSNWKTNTIQDSRMQEYINELGDLENASKWHIADID